MGNRIEKRLGSEFKKDQNFNDVTSLLVYLIIIINFK